MALTQTQSIGYSLEDDINNEPWGRLCPTTGTAYPVIELNEDVVIFGRDTARCTELLNEPQISGIHTEIHRNPNFGMESTMDSHIAIIHDLSTNGTYLNKKKIGKNKQNYLFDGDEIQFISYCKKDKKTGKERKKISFIFYKNRNVFCSTDYDPNSIFAKYDLRSTLGTGSFATVKLGIDRESGERYAVKEIDKKKYELKSKSRKTGSIMNEANILRQINHENIIQVYDVFDENNTLYIVLEMALGGELFQRIIDNKRLSEDISRYIMKQLISAITYLHDNNIAHRDLKPENILMKDKKSWEIKITDFGLSRLLDCDNEMLTTMCGTPLFLAPEVLTSKKRGGYGFEVDYWSIGVILYLMLVGHPPYNEKEGGLLELVKNGRFSFPQQTWSKISDEAKDLVMKLMEMNVKKRYNGQQVLQHKWMRVNDDKHNHNNHNDQNQIILSGKKRKIDINYQDDMEQKEESEPPLKRYKNANGDGVDMNQMSMDSFGSNNLTPFDSIIDKAEPQRNGNNDERKKKKNGQKRHHHSNHNHNHNVYGSEDVINGNNGNDANGNGASFVLKHSVSLKEMSLD